LDRRFANHQAWDPVSGLERDCRRIVLSLEQTENYAREHGPEGDRDEWHNRNAGISEATSKGVGKWMPEELIALAERNVKK
jgi:hypothetical protein